jgi:hypothetical protein
MIRIRHLFQRNMGILNRKSVNQRVSGFEYAVRGAQAIRAEELRNVFNDNVATSNKPRIFTIQTNCVL